MLRIHIQTGGENLPTSQAMPVVLNDPPMTVYVKNPPAITENDINGIKSKPSSAGNAVKIILNAHGKEKLHAVTVSHRGQIMVIILNGRVIYAPVIDHVVSNGVIIIPDGISDEELNILKEDLAELLEERRGN